MHSRVHPGTQRGSIVISTAIFLGMAIVLLLGAELGYLYSVKREFQKTADLAAMAGAQKTASDATSAGCSDAKTAAESNAAANLGAGILAVADAAIVATPGRWTRVDGFTAASTGCNTVKVVISKTPDLLFPGIAGNAQSEISATATATRATPRAVLNIQSKLASVDSTKSPLLNAVFGGLLGGSVNLSAVGWDGLAKTNINLLSYLDQLAINLGVEAGNYEQLLATNTSAHALFQAAIDVMQHEGSTAAASVDALAGMLDLQAAAPSAAPPMKLGELLQVQSGTPAAGLDLGLQAFQLAQGIVQLAGSKSAAAANISSGPLGTSIQVKVIEPPQISAIGNPELAKADPYGPNQIFVRTAQVRTLISVDLTSPLGSVAGLLNAISNVTQPVTDLLNNVLQLNLIATLNSLTCVLYCSQQAQVTDLKVLPSPIRIDVNLDIAAGNARVTDYACLDGGNKSLTVPAQSSAADIRIGKLGTSAADAAAKVFSSATVPAVEPIPLIDIGTMTVKKECTLAILCSTTWKKGSGWVSDKSLADRDAFAGGGIALKTEASVVGSAQQLVYVALPATGLPDIDQAPAYQPIAQPDIAGGLSNTLAGIDIHMYKPDTEGGLGGLLLGVGNVLDGVVALLQAAISTVLSPLLDPLLHLLLDGLGVDLTKADVGARLSCNQGVELVY